MTTANPRPLLSLVRGAETRLGYDDVSDYAKTVHPTSKRPSTMTVAEVQEWQREAKRKGAQSTAFGGYQFISGTFDGVVEELGLSPDTVLTPEVQDRMGEQLLRRRGYDAWAAGTMSDDDFIAGLSQEWAGLPSLSGQSHYAGDGLNGATRDLGQLRNALELARSGQDVDLSGLPPGSNWVPTTPRVPTALPSDEEEAELEEFATPIPTFTSTTDEYFAAKQAENERDPSFMEAVRAAGSDEWAAAWLFRQAGAEKFAPDLNFTIDKDRAKAFAEGLPQEYAEEYMAEAVSEAHLQFLKEQALADFKRDETIAANGSVAAFGLRLGAAMTDPIGIAAGLVTGGAATAGMKGDRIRRFIVGGAAGAAANAAVDGYIATQDPMMGIGDVMFSTMAGFVLGGAGGALSKSRLNQDLDQAFRTALEEVRTGVPAGGLPEGSSVGAQQVPQELPLNGARWAAKVSEGAPKTAMGAIRFDIAGRLKSSDNDMVRMLGGELVEDAVGNADGSVVRFSASERITQETRKRFSRFYRTADKAFAEWAKAQGKSRLRVDTRSEFFNQVGRAVRRPLDAGGDPHVNAVASYMKTELGDMLRYAKENGLKGFENVKENTEYLTRQHNIKRIDELTEKYGEGQLNMLVWESMREFARKQKNMSLDALDLDADTMGKVASAYLRSIRNRRFSDFDLQRAISGDQEDTLRELLEDAGIEGDALTNILSAVTNTPTGADAGKLASGRRRLGLDETVEVKAYDRRITGGPLETLRMEDLFENDAEHLFHNYVRSMVGHAELKRVFDKFVIPNSTGTTPSWATIKAHLFENGAKQADVDNLEAVVNTLQGKPAEARKRWHEAARLARDYNFVRLMGQVGWAQVAEVGQILGHAGWRATMQQMPILRKLYADAKTGQLGEPLLKELEYHLAFGTDLVRHSPTVRPDDFGVREEMGLNKPWARQADFTLQQAKQLTSVTSGMAHINMGLQRFAVSALAQKFANFAQNGKGLGVRRLRALGLDEADVELISEALRTHPERIDGPFGRRVKSLNLEAWDPTARSTFLNALDRYTKRVIQENDLGNMPLFMTKEAGKVIFQFRSFMLASYPKQLLAGINMRDRAATASFLYSTMFGGLAYIAQTHLNALGREDREAYLERKLAPTELAAASFQRAGHSSIIPMVWDTAVQPMIADDALFNARTTGMGTAIWDNPTWSMVEGLRTTTQAVGRSTWDPTHDFTREDWRAFTGLLAFQRSMGISNGLNAIGEASFNSRYELGQQ